MSADRFLDWSHRSRRATALWLERTIEPVWKVRAELGAAVLLLAGWTLITAGVAQFIHRSPWLLSAGLFALTMFGWRFLYTIGRDGLYSLTRPPKSPRG
jgi:hypothetical protein